VVVACYRDGGSVHEMYGRLTAILRSITPSYEIIYVNDNSPDDAGELLGQLAGRDPRLTVITHSRNFGSQMAFTSGMQQAVGDGRDPDGWRSARSSGGHSITGSRMAQGL